MRHRKSTHNQTRWQRRCKQRSRPTAPQWLGYVASPSELQAGSRGSAPKEEVASVHLADPAMLAIAAIAASRGLQVRKRSV